MKKSFLIFSILFVAISSFSQRGKDAQLEDSIFTWKAIPKINATQYPRTFSQPQLKHPELFAQWLQKSYIPIGALDFSYAIAEPNKKDEVQPYATGINAAMWRAMWDNAGSKIIRQPHSENSIYLLTNYIIDAETIPMLTTPGRAVFMRRSPDISKAFMGSSERRNQFVKQLRLEGHQQIGKYIIQYYGCDGDGCQPLVAVYLAPDNKLPIRQLNRRDVLDMIEQVIPKELERAKRIIPNESHLAESRLKSNIEKLRKKYSSTLNTPAEMRNADPVDITDIFNGDDIFDTEQQQRMKLNTYGVYTYEDGVLQKSKQDQPLWICISWKPADNQYHPYEREIHRSMITHFNFDYVYDYFFKPEKVKSKPYTILNEDAQKVHLASYKNAAVIKITPLKKSNAGAWYFEDFSAGTSGKKPNGWYAGSTGNAATITKLNGENTNWLKLGDHTAMPDDHGKLLPKNFKMEFDVATDKGFTENTGGGFLLRIHNKILRPQGDYTDAPKQIFIDLDAKAGNEKFTRNPTGYSRIKTTYRGMNNSVRHADVLQYNNDFSNVKNRVCYTIIKQGNNVRGFIDGKEIIPLDKNSQPIPDFNRLPEDARFTNFYFENITNSSSKQVSIYITNIKITAL